MKNATTAMNVENIKYNTFYENPSAYIPRKMVDCRKRFLTEGMRNYDVILSTTTGPF